MADPSTNNKTVSENKEVTNCKYAEWPLKKQKIFIRVKNMKVTTEKYVTAGEEEKTGLAQVTIKDPFNKLL